MSRREGIAGQYIPEMIQTHPVTSNRIAEARSARRAVRASEGHRSPPRYELHSRAPARDHRIRASGHRRAATRRKRSPSKASLGQQYGTALALMASGKNQDAAEILHDLVEKHENLTLLYIALAQAEVDGGMQNDGIATFQRADAALPAQRAAHRALRRSADGKRARRRKRTRCCWTCSTTCADAGADSAHRAWRRAPPATRAMRTTT